MHTHIITSTLAHSVVIPESAPVDWLYTANASQDDDLKGAALL